MSQCAGKVLGNNCYRLHYPSLNEMHQADESNNPAGKAVLMTTKKRGNLMQDHRSCLSASQLGFVNISFHW